MQFNNKNNFGSLPFKKNIGCIGFLIGLLLISILLFLGFFVGLFFLGVFLIFYIYRYLRNKINKNNNLSKKNDEFTDAEYIEISNEDDDSKI